MTVQWYGLVDRTVIGPFAVDDLWYHAHAGMTWRASVIQAGHPDPWRVGWDELPGGFAVSTVFLGLDHQWRPDGPLELFETLTSGPSEEDERMYRYSTWEQAEEGHAAMVALIVAMVNTANSGEQGERSG